MTTRPNQHLINVMRNYPNLSQLVDEFRQSKGKDLPNWRNYCFLPIAAWYSIVSNTQNKGLPLVELQQLRELQLLSAVGTWRYSQGIYEFDQDIYNAVMGSEITGDLPSQVLLRLPEWCIYIKTPSLTAFEQKTHGFFVQLEHDMNHGHTELRMLIDGENDFICVPLHLGNWSLHEAIKKYIDTSKLEAEKHGAEKPIDININEHQIAKEILPFVALTLYICSDPPNINNLEAPNYSPSQPKPKKTKKGWRLFPAKKHKVWQVGNKDGDLIRSERKECEQTGQKRKRHLRRGHYHTYWVGKRGSDEQRAILKWVNPTIVS